MADKNILEQMLGHLVNDDKQKAEELFHEYVVAKSREIYESLIESEMADDEEDEEVDEAVDADEDEEEVEENFEFAEAGDEMGDDLAGELDAGDEMGDEMGGEDEPSEKGEEELFQDLEAIVDELQAKFDELKGVEGDEHGDEFGGDDEMPEESFGDLATVREYVEKVADGHGAEKKGKGESADGSATGLKFQKNDMGGTAANILGGKNGTQAGEVGAPGGAVKGSALSDTKAGDNPHAKGNVNVPGGNAGKTGFKTKEAGHGAEKAGTKETADKAAAGLFRGRR